MSERRMDRKLIGRCGKFCGECRVYAASHGGTAADREALARELGVDAARVACEGCQGLTDKCYAAECKIVACLEEHGYNYCVECAEINDCTKYARLNAEAGGKPRINSSQLRAWGEERWLKYHLGGESAEEKKGTS